MGFYRKPREEFDIIVSGHNGLDPMIPDAEYIAEWNKGEEIINEAAEDAYQRNIPINLFGAFNIADSIVLPYGSTLQSLSHTNDSFIGIKDGVNKADIDMITVEPDERGVTLTTLKNLSLWGFSLDTWDEANQNDMRSLIHLPATDPSNWSYLFIEQLEINPFTKPETGLCAGILADQSLGGWILNTQVIGAGEASVCNGIMAKTFYEYYSLNTIFATLTYGLNASVSVVNSTLEAPNIRSSVINPLASNNGRFKVIGSGIEKLFNNAGSATINAGATSKVINHGCCFTPTLQEITIKPGSAKAVDWYVDTITSSQFTVHFPDPTPSNLTFGWEVRYI